MIELAELQEAWESGIEGVFAYRSAGETPEVETIDFPPRTSTYTAAPRSPVRA